MAGTRQQVTPFCNPPPPHPLAHTASLLAEYAKRRSKLLLLRGKDHRISLPGTFLHYPLVQRTVGCVPPRGFPSPHQSRTLPWKAPPPPAGTCGAALWEQRFRTAALAFTGHPPENTPSDTPKRIVGKWGRRAAIREQRCTFQENAATGRRDRGQPRSDSRRLRLLSHSPVPCSMWCSAPAPQSVSHSTALHPERASSTITARPEGPFRWRGLFGGGGGCLGSAKALARPAEGLIS